MALSNTFSFTITTAEVIREACLNVGILGEGEILTAQEYTDCLRKLNMLIKQRMARQDFSPGLKMWERARGELFLSSSKGVYQLGPSGDNWACGVATSTDPSVTYQTSQLSVGASAGASTLNIGTTSIVQLTVDDYVVIQLDSGDIYSSTVGSIDSGAGTFTLGNSNTLPSSAGTGAYVWNYSTKGQRPLAIVTAVLRDSNNNDTPLDVMTLQDYELLPTKTAIQYQQDPTAFYYESQIGSQLNTPVITGGGMLYLDCGAAQDVTKHLHIVYDRPLMDLVNPTDNLECPQSVYDDICWSLSRRICPMFDGEWTPVMNLNYQEATLLSRQADADTTSMYFASDEDNL